MSTKDLRRAEKALRLAGYEILDGKYRHYCPGSRLRSMRFGKRWSRRARRREAKALIALIT